MKVIGYINQEMAIFTNKGCESDLNKKTAALAEKYL